MRSSKCEIVIDYRVYTAYVHIWTYSPLITYIVMPEMVVVETLWQLHTLTVMNSCSRPVGNFTSLQCSICIKCAKVLGVY